MCVCVCVCVCVYRVCVCVCVCVCVRARGAAQALPGRPAGLGLAERVQMQGGHGAVCTPAPPGEAHGWGVPGLISQFAQ